MAEMIAAPWALGDFNFCRILCVGVYLYVIHFMGIFIKILVKWFILFPIVPMVLLMVIILYTDSVLQKLLLYCNTITVYFVVYVLLLYVYSS